MNENTEKFLECVCDRYCRFPHQVEDEEEMIEKCTNCQVESLLLGTMAAELVNYQEKITEYAEKHWSKEQTELLRKAIKSLNEEGK